MKRIINSSKKNKRRPLIIGLIIIGMIIILIFFTNNSNIVANNYVEDQFDGSDLVHFTNMPITYSLDVNTAYGLSASSQSNTDEYQKERIRWAFGMLENATDGMLKFKEVEINETADISIYGVPEFNCYEENETYTGGIEGYASPNVTENDTRINNAFVVYCAPYYALIQGNDGVGLVLEDIDPENIGYSWKENACDAFPMLEMHEILHALGFGHTYEDSEELMYPIDFKIQSCQGDKLDEKTISCLKNIYSEGQIGSCENIDLYPFEEDPTLNISNFAWDSLPISYFVKDCNEIQELNLQRGEMILEGRLGYDVFNLTENSFSDVTFTCMSPLGDVTLNWETDFWSTTNYFPAAQPYYRFDDSGQIKKVEIILFGKDRECGGIEVHELLHAAGVRTHEGYWMWYEKEVCSSQGGVLDTDSLNAVRELYGL